MDITYIIIHILCYIHLNCTQEKLCPKKKCVGRIAQSQKQRKGSDGNENQSQKRHGSGLYRCRFRQVLLYK